MLVSDRHPYQTLYVSSNDLQLQSVIRPFLQYFNTSQKIDKAYRVLNDDELEYRGLGMNDDSIQIEEEFVIFDYSYDKSGLLLGDLYPYKLPILDFRNFLRSAKEFILKYEEHQIPGLIPRQDFLEWSTAPNTQINKKYLDEQNILREILLKEIGITDNLQDVIEIMKKSPQLFEDLKKYIVFTEKKATKIKGLQLAIKKIIKSKAYYGNIEGAMYYHVIDLKIKEFNLPESIRAEISNRIGYKDFEIGELDNLLREWVEKLSNYRLIDDLVKLIGLDNLKNELMDTFKKYPNLLIELEELIPKHTEELSIRFLRETMKEKIRSNNSSENLEGYFKGKIIKYLVEKYQLPNEKYQSSEELRQWSFKNKWSLTGFGKYINENMK